MEITPATSAATPKARTSKGRAAGEAEPTKSAAPKKTKTATPAGTAESKPKKAASPRNSKTKAAAAESATENEVMIQSITVVQQPSSEELTGMIAQAAYFIAAQRDFAPGNELQDWLNAEREVLRRFAQ